MLSTHHSLQALAVVGVLISLTASPSYAAADCNCNLTGAGQCNASGGVPCYKTVANDTLGNAYPNVVQDYFSYSGTTASGLTGNRVKSGTGTLFRGDDEDHANIVYYRTNWSSVTNSNLGKLLVFLPGRGAQPRNYTNFLKTAAASGYRAVIALSWVNASDEAGHEIAPPDVCTASAGIFSTEAARQECFVNLRGWLAYGQNMSSTYAAEFPYVAQYPGADNNIDRRLTDLIDWLRQKFPNQSWGDYINTSTNNVIYTNNITLAGHSSGGGQAAFMANQINVRRLILLASSEDDIGPITFVSPVSPSFLATHPTPSSSMFALWHDTDPFVLSIEANVGSGGLNLPGSPIDVNVNPAPWNTNLYVGSTDSTNPVPTSCYGASVPANGHNWVASNCDPNIAYRAVWQSILQK